jgi:carboxyl-terminal processing protease
LTESIAHLKKQAGGTLNGFVLDLRNDPGGLLDAAVDVTGDFVAGGTVVTTRGRQSEDDEVYSAPAGSDLIPNTPLVVLINGASASASEIVAGALQDDHRATVMGTRSFGKGSVQTIIPLNGRGALRLTTARYYTPAGRSIQDEGIAPDIVVSVPREEQVTSAVTLHEADLRGALKNTGSLNSARAAKPGEATPAAGETRLEEPVITQALIGTPKDAQLKAALKFLQSPIAKAPAPAQGPASAAADLNAPH